MVNVANGNLLVQSMDVDVPERGIDLAFERTYNSQSRHDASNTYLSGQGIFGNGWTSTFDAHMAYDSTHNIMSVYDLDGARYDYTSDGAGNWISPAGMAGLRLTIAATAQYANNTCYYQWTKKNGTAYIFARPDWSAKACGSAGYNGRIMEIFGRNSNNWVRFDYSWYNGDSSAANNISQINVAHADGQSLTLAFATFGGHDELHTLTRSGDGQSTSYWYDASGNLTDVCAIGNGSTAAANGPCSAGQIHYQYAYNAGSYQLAYINSANWVMTNYECGTYQTYGYDGANRITAISDTGTSNPYIADGTNGGSVQTGCSGSGSVLQPNYATTYGSQQTLYYSQWYTYGSGQTSFVDIDGHKRAWLYDALARVTQTQEWPNPNVATAFVSSASWDTDGLHNNNLNETVDYRGQATDYGYDANGNTIWVQQPQVTTSLGTGRPVARYGYDQYNNVVAYCDPQYVWTSGVTTCIAGSGVTHYTWNYSDAAEPYGYLTDTYTPLGYHSALSYNQSLENGDNGIPTDVVGDSFSQVDGTTVQPQQHFTYDTHGNVATYNKGYGSWSLSYDALNRLTAATDPDGVTSRTCYFPDGAVSAKQSAYQYALDGNVVCGPHAEQFTYDADGNEVLETHHHGQTTTNSVVKSVTQKWYDGNDRLVEVEMPSDTATDNQIPWRTRYIYDLSRGTAVSISAPNQSPSFYAYGNLYKTQHYINSAWRDINGNAFDALDRSTARYQYAPGTATTSTIPGSIQGNLETWSSVYDAAPYTGLLTSKTDPLQVTTTYGYDSLNRTNSTTFSDGTPSRSYMFDPDGRTASISSSQSVTDAYAYDTDGRVTQYTEASGGGVTSPAVLSYSYYPDGQRSALSISSQAISQQNQFTYAYRNDGLRTKLNVAGQTQPFSWTYDNAGRELTQSDPLTSSTFQPKTTSYDSYGQISSLTLPGSITETGCATYKTQNLQYSNLQYSTDGELTGLNTNASQTTGCGYTFVTGVEYQYDVRGEQTFIGARSPSSAMVEAGGNSYVYGVPCAARSNTVSPPAMPSNPPPAPGYSGVLCPGQDIDPYTGVSGYAGGAQYGDGCPGALNWAFDNAGRQSTQSIMRVSKAGCTDSTAVSMTRTYDAENHLVQSNSVASPFYSSTTHETLGWGPNGKVRTDYQDPQPGYVPTKTFTLHWDGDELLFVTDQTGQLLQLNVEHLGAVAGPPGQQSFVVSDRDMNNVIANARAVGYLAGSAPYVQSGWNVLNGAGVSSGKYQLDKVTDGGGGAAYLLYNSPRTDGYMIAGVAIQGVRAHDPGTQQWTTPDAYKGDVHDPMSQRSYMWNNNNPIAYSDPSGYDRVEAVFRNVWEAWSKQAGGPQHTYIKITTDRGSKNISFGPTAGHLRLQGPTFENGHRPNSQVTLCSGNCSSQERAITQYANNLNHANYFYLGITQNSNSAAAGAAQSIGKNLSGSVSGWVPGLSQPQPAQRAPSPTTLPSHSNSPH